MRSEEKKENNENNEGKPVFLFTEHQADILIHIIVGILAVVFFFVVK